MSDEPTERDVEALAEVLATTPPTLFVDRRVARLILASDWYAERIADARREGAAEVTARVEAVINDVGSGRGFTYVQEWWKVKNRLLAALRGDA